MVTFLTSIVALLLGYFLYSKYIAKLLNLNSSNVTPAYRLKDDIDFVPMAKQKNAIVQLLNIAGTGPVFGPILAALYGPVVLLWIVIGAIFAGAVHDFTIGVISLRNNGYTLPMLAQKYFGNIAKHIVKFFTALLLLLVATVFVVGPANLLVNLFSFINLYVAIAGIFGFYMLVTILPINQIIGKIYPFIGGLFIMGSFLLLGYLLFSGIKIPEVNLQNLHPQGLPIFPLLFLILSCGAISGFHATQSPLIARTLQNENQARYVFYGMMIGEAIIALVWASITLAMLNGNTLLDLINQGTPSLVVNNVAKAALGSWLSVIVILGVIMLPLTSGGTSFRALRLMLAEYLKINQVKLVNRVLIIAPFFAVSVMLTFIDFQLLWRYFSFANQTLAAITLWIATAYLLQNKKNILATLLPAIFMTIVVITYLLYAPIGFGLNIGVSTIIAMGCTVAIAFLVIKRKYVN